MLLFYSCSLQDLLWGEIPVLVWLVDKISSESFSTCNPLIIYDLLINANVLFSINITVVLLIKDQVIECRISLWCASLKWSVPQWPFWWPFCKFKFNLVSSVMAKFSNINSHCERYLEWNFIWPASHCNKKVTRI